MIKIYIFFVLLPKKKAYVNGLRQGRVLEKVFRVGESIAFESSVSEKGDRESLQILDIEKEMKLGLCSDEALDDNSATQTMKELGLQRYNKYVNF